MVPRVTKTDCKTLMGGVYLARLAGRACGNEELTKAAETVHAFVKAYGGKFLDANGDLQLDAPGRIEGEAAVGHA
jgi:hypothetical protein